ncbi:MAG: heme-binding protein [Planctomycetota bacterium]|jgi:hypothetical protein
MLKALLALTLLTSLTAASESYGARMEAADILRFTLAAHDKQGGHDGDAGRMLAATEAAAETLGESLLGDRLRASAVEARLRESVDAGSSLPALEGALRQALTDLEFEPIMEAALPEGFPAPTPVGEVEVKTYPAYRIARADSGGDGAFWQLFVHIQKHDIPMTAPVEMTYDASGREVDMAFMYERVAQGRTGPDGPVEVLDVEPMLVASIGCRGWSSDAAVERAKAQLTAWIEARDDLAVAGAVRQFGYNSPSVSGSRRYFEVQIPVARVDAEPLVTASRGR